MKKNFNRNPSGNNQWELRTNDEITKGFDKYPYETSYDCENNFAPVTIFDINDMKKYK